MFEEGHNTDKGRDTEMKETPEGQKMVDQEAEADGQDTKNTNTIQ